ncbi:MAG: methenyltetrahydromethanopterin cyclohydrolase [Planctomycetes bacterium]|nr:methenyltetrahydromethanopterin cyclohydrolase [Planctomycetota bacterium]
MDLELNSVTAEYIEEILEDPSGLKIVSDDESQDGVLLDFGINAEGGLDAGCVLATICTACLGDIVLTPGQLGGWGWNYVSIDTDFPVAACLFSQYAGWQINVEKFFAMGSGPMRAAYAKEELFDKLWYREEANDVVGVLETHKLPGPDVFEYVAEQAGVDPSHVTLCVAPTSSIAGNLQVVARSVETALHKLHEVGFDVNRIRSASGSAPLPPVAKNDMEGIGRTNDAILYGARVTLWVNGDDDSLADIVSKVPASSSNMYGEPFLKVFEAVGRDFYKVDPLLFSPAQVILQNIDTGRVHCAGQVNEELLKRSFGIS